MYSSEVVDSARRRGDGEVVGHLVHAASAGDQAAWNALVERFSGLVWGIARAHRLNTADASEITQTVWLKLVENLSGIREPRAIGAWLASVTRHECLRHIARAGRTVFVADIAVHEPPEPADDIDAALQAGERGKALRQAFERLPPQWRSLMRLLVVEPRLSYGEIAAALDMPVGSIGPIRQRCLRRLRNSPELRAIAGMTS